MKYNHCRTCWKQKTETRNTSISINMDRPCAGNYLQFRYQYVMNWYSRDVSLHIECFESLPYCFKIVLFQNITLRFPTTLADTVYWHTSFTIWELIFFPALNVCPPQNGPVIISVRSPLKQHHDESKIILLSPLNECNWLIRKFRLLVSVAWLIVSSLLKQVNQGHRDIMYSAWHIL